MRLSRFIRIHLLLLVLVAVQGGEAKGELGLPTPITKLLDTYCFTCHDGDTLKGDIRLDNLSALPLSERLGLLNNVQEQLFSGEMPPKKKAQPTIAERDALLGWLSAELGKHKASKLEDKLRYYRYGNLINHEALFSGKIPDKSFTPARRWRINELIYMELINNVLELKGKGRRSSFYGVVKPFNLPADSGVKYYDTEIVEGGQFLTLLANAEWVVSKQLRPALLKSGDFKFPEAYLALLNGSSEEKRSLGKNFPDEQWNLKVSAKAFEEVVMAKDGPSKTQLQAAITHQFSVAMQRPPTDEEMARYLQFMHENIAIAGTAKTLAKMMVAVLMEPDFLYRSEFGDGKPDAYGRTQLTPREGSYAIAYALTDQTPDGALIEAAKAGRLATRQDYEREVARILNDATIAKPRLLRFFQDYFGYYNIFSVFKDEERFVGAYNPHRVVAAKYIYRIPGKISQEADTLVLSILKKDQDVLKHLLTTDQYFVDHSGDSQAMEVAAQKMEESDRKNRETYNILKGYKGEALVDAARQNNLYTSNGKVGTRSLFNDMANFRILYGEDGKRGMDRRPIPKDGEGVEHSMKMYNLDYRTWSYVANQPFKIENRSGMLTHPAWLVSFSHNAETDPVRRGKWIQEKLLAGFIPDVPITVDAKVPEDHQRTLRERYSIVEKTECWRCHQKMNPLGNPFESYDDFGRYRTEESLEYEENIIKSYTEMARDHNGIINDYKVTIYKTKPIDAKGRLEGTGDKTLDGDVSGAIDLTRRLAASDRVRQSFIRNVFRYFMGRNEMFSDSQTLIAADKAYVQSGGSFTALVVSLLTSDSFLYRKQFKD